MGKPLWLLLLGAVPALAQDRGAALLPPDIACPSGQGRCYSQAQLERVAATLAGQDGGERAYIQSVFADKAVRQDNDVTARQVQAIWKYFNLEESGKDLINQNAGRMSSGDRQDMRSITGQLRQDMYGTLLDTPFHAALMNSDDPWAERIMSAGQWQQAQPSNPLAYLYGAEQSLAQGQFPTAASQATQALALDAESARAYALRAQAEYGMGDAAAAQADAERALAIDPSDAPAAATLGMIRAARTARKTHFDLVEFSPESGGAGGGRLSSGVGARSRKLSGVLKEGEAASLVDGAREAMETLDVQTELKKASQAVRMDPTDPQAYFTRAEAYLRLGSPKAALGDLSRAAALSPRNASIAALKSYALVKARRFKDALAAADAASALDPNNSHAWLFRAMSLAGLGRREEMIDSLRNAARLNPRFGAYLQKALREPAEKDLLDAFDGDASSEPQPGLQIPWTGLPWARRLAIYGLPAAGVLLLVLGLWHGIVAFRRGSVDGAAAYLPIASPEAEATLIDGHVKLLRVLGSGGMGIVYEGLDLRLDRRVAVKRMRGDVNASPRERERFLSEARIVAKLSHPNVVAIHSVTEHAGEIHLVFEYVDGRTFAAMFSSSRPLALDRAVSILRGVAEALDYAHRKGVIHRDLKPSNIMVTREGLAKVMDFGIASFAREAMTRLTQTGAVLGTPVYMAPEQAMGEPAPQSDIYSLALCAYEALSGRLPFDGSFEGLLKRKLDGLREPLSWNYKDGSGRLDAVFAKALDPDPARRHQSAGEFVEDLTA